jgi:hypothetical protein
VTVTAVAVNDFAAVTDTLLDGEGALGDALASRLALGPPLHIPNAGWHPALQ